MKIYRIKGEGNRHEFMKVLREMPGGYDVLITRGYETYTKEKRTFLSRSMFQSCLETGYLIEVAAEALSFSA